MLAIDKCAYSNNLRDVNSILKLTIMSIFILISMIFKNIYMYIGIIVIMSSSIVVLAKIDVELYVKCLKIPVFFLILGIGVNLISISLDNTQLLYSFKIFNIYIGTTLVSIKSSVYLLLRSISCIVSIYFFILTTPFNELIYVLKKLHIQDTLIEIIILTYRFIFIFIEELNEIYKSQQLKFGYINLKNSYKSTGLLVNTLFFRMMRRYEDMSISLDMKLYDGKFHV